MKLKSGMFARCEITSQTKNNTMLLPEDAIITNNDQTTSVYVNEGGNAKLKAVTIGLKNAGKTEIISGLTGNEKVVVSGKERLSEGVQVKEN
jgi:membrane fusion protein (multidrug efflux system)